MRRIRGFLTLAFFPCLLLSCTRAPEEKPEPAPAAAKSAAHPLAILQTGEYPLWFQLTEDGPVHIESIEDAVNTAALIPWPLALHVRFLQETEDGIVMVINRDGFIKLAPDSGTSGIAVYRFPGGGLWRQYTAGGFAFYDGVPAAVLYLDDRFLDSNASPPVPGTWAFNMESNALFPLDIPAFRPFPAEEGWSVEVLRSGGDGFFYYRAVNRGAPQREIRMFRTADLAQTGEEITADVFYSSAPRADEITDPLLPPLPPGFVYTGIAETGGSMLAGWEEQEDFYTGAAGFMVIKR